MGVEGQGGLRVEMLNGVISFAQYSDGLPQLPVICTPAPAGWLVDTFVNTPRQEPVTPKPESILNHS